MNAGIHNCLNNSVLLRTVDATYFKVRFIRIAGCEVHFGADYNVVKDKSIDEPILRLIELMTQKRTLRISCRSLPIRTTKVDGLSRRRNTQNFHGMKESSMPLPIGTGLRPDSSSRSACTMTGWRLRVRDGFRIS